MTTTAGEAVQQGANSASSNVLSVEISTSGNVEAVSTGLASAMASQEFANLPAGFTMNGSCGGRVSVPDSQLSAFNSTSGPVFFSMTFVEYCDLSVGAQYTIDGNVSFNYNDIADLDKGFSVDYNGVTLNDGSGPVTINMTVDCTDLSNCSIVSDYIGEDGNIYRVSDISLSGDATFGFNGTATFYHPTHGSVSIVATSVTYGNCGGFPDGGSVSTTGIAGSAEILFNNDCSYVINYDDGAGDVGVINGSFI